MTMIAHALSSVKSAAAVHRLALLGAFIVGIIYVAPHLMFVFSLGSAYRGIPMMQTANEDLYMFRIHEVLDGHYALGSPIYYEYKNEWPVTPPTGEWLFALPTLLLGIPFVSVLVASKFVVPFILFLLVYALTYALLTGEDGLGKKLSAIAAAALVVLGYDLVDFRSLLHFLSGNGGLDGYFLLWSRPVNPGLGAMMLFPFLLVLLAAVRGMRRAGFVTIAGALLFALMVGNYFFSWTLGLSVLAMLCIIYGVRKQFGAVKRLLAILGAGAVLTSPYWYFSWRASHGPWYRETLLRNGLFYTHYPLMNRLLLAVLMFYALLVAYAYFRSAKSVANGERANAGFTDWHWFTLALMLGGLWAFNQQVVTGITVWPFHFVQYTVPFAMVTVVVLLYNIVRNYSRALWGMAIAFFMIASLAFGVTVQARVYRQNFAYYEALQSYAPMFRFLDGRAGDCVVLAKDDAYTNYSLRGLIPAFTHCDVYDSDAIPSSMPYDRLYHNYLVRLRLRGIGAHDIDAYVEDNFSEVRNALYTSWQGIFGVQEFPDFYDAALYERAKKLPDDYRAFLRTDFASELSRYRLDYVVSVGALETATLRELPGLKLAFSSGNLFAYRFDR